MHLLAHLLTCPASSPASQQELQLAHEQQEALQAEAAGAQQQRSELASSLAGNQLQAWRLLEM